MLYDVLIFLPFFACLFWIVFTCWMASRTSFFHPLLITLVVMLAYMFTDCAYASPNIPPRILVYTAILAEFSAPSLLPLVWMYLLRLRGQEHFRAIQVVWLVLPTMLGFISGTITILAGADRIQALQAIVHAGGYQFDIPTHETILLAYSFVTAWLFRGVLVAEALFYIALAIRLMRSADFRPRHIRTLFTGERVRVLELQFFSILLLLIPFLPKMVLAHTTLMEYPWISAVLAVWIAAGVCIFCYLSLFGARDSVSLREMRNVMRYNYRSENKAEIVGEMMDDLLRDAGEETLLRLQDRFASREDANKPPTSNFLSTVAKTRDDDGLLSRFEQLVLHGQAFLEPGLTLSDVADRLHSNKTYVSRLVNNTYSLPFPDLINSLRVDYAGQYLVEHRNARQNEIASACGFASASSFNNIFKKVTGMTPKIWLAAYDHLGHAPKGSPEHIVPHTGPDESES
jgi:AraC-like DNA-binding protein